MVPEKRVRQLKVVLVIAAMPLELKWIRPRTDVRWIKRASGPGPRLASKAVDAVGHCADTVISAGLCGALDPALRLGDIVIGTAVNGVPTESLAGVQGFRTIAGPIASVDYVADLPQKRELQATGAIAVEMEAAAVLERAREWGKPFYCVKAVSDTAQEGFALDLNASRDESGRFRIWHLLGQAVRRPSAGIPELWKLHSNSKVAAEALGSFLMCCQF